MGLPRAIAKDTITILRPTMIVDHGSRVPDWTQPPAETIIVLGCSVQPAPGGDDRSHRDATSALFSVWAPLGTEIGVNDRVLVDQYDGPLMITGETLNWNAHQPLDHVLINLADWRG